MILKITDLLKSKYNIDGTIILFRTGYSRKHYLCEFLSSQVTIPEGQIIAAGTHGAFGLALAKKYPNNTVELMGDISAEYKQQTDKLSNVKYVKKYSEGAFVFNQYNDSLVLEHYAQFFPTILEEVKDEKIDAFCDCGHTCGCFAGLMKSGLRPDWTWVLGISNQVINRNGNAYICQIPNRNEIVNSFYSRYDTQELRNDIETAYPEFGNVFEATRSVSAAMNWLRSNPDKTVLVYVGDSPVYGG